MHLKVSYSPYKKISNNLPRKYHPLQMLKPEAYRHKRILEYLNAREVEDRLQ